MDLLLLVFKLYQTILNHNITQISKTKTEKFFNKSELTMDCLRVCKILVISCRRQKYSAQCDLQSNPWMLIIFHEDYLLYLTDRLSNFNTENRTVGTKNDVPTTHDFLLSLEATAEDNSTYSGISDPRFH